MFHIQSPTSASAVLTRGVRKSCGCSADFSRYEFIRESRCFKQNILLSQRFLRYAISGILAGYISAE